MTDFLTTELARPSDDPGTQAKAIVYLWRTGNLDLLAALGLDAALNARRGPAKPKPTRCPICDNKLPKHGVCRKRQACREAARERGEIA